jgi:RND family efflux transporter MFP subunit
MGNAAYKHSDVAATVDKTQNPELASLHTRATRAEKLAAHQAVLVNMLVELLASNSLEGALDAFAGAMKSRFECDRVAIALITDGELKLSAVSQQGVLAATSSEARLLVDAMSEACSQESVICWPLSSDNLGVMIAHRSLAGRRLSSSICSVPMYDKQVLVGAFLLERRDQRAFPVLTLERLSVCLAPLLLLYRQADRGWWAVFQRSMHTQLERVLGRERPGMRLLCILAAMVLVGSLTLTTRWQVVATAELLPHERRVITAPLAGFVADMPVAAGDHVTKGQVLARLDRRELELEAASRDSDVTMAEAEFRAAMASQDHQTTGIARARLVQARARREHVEQQLNRAELVSPIDGLVIAADATRSQGTPVSRGEILFEVAPSADFEVNVLVDEADVYDVHPGQSGMLSLRAMPGEKLPIVVDSVYPVAEAKDGKNRFRVRANLVEPETRLRPGQSGVVRLQAGRKNLLGVLTRRLNRRLSELWWQWIG